MSARSFHVPRRHVRVAPLLGIFLTGTAAAAVGASAAAGAAAVVAAVELAGARAEAAVVVRSQEAPPAVVVGTIRYGERGMGASYDGMAMGFIGGAAGAPVATFRMARAIEEIFTNPVAVAALPPSMRGVSDWMRGEGPDISSLPIIAGYDAHISFRLGLADDGTYRLQEGILEYTNSNHTAFGGEEGGFFDSFSGGDILALDPDRDRIELTVDRDAKPQRYMLDVEVNHPLIVNGHSEFRISVLGTVARFVRRGEVTHMESSMPWVPSGEISDEAPVKLVTYLATDTLPSRRPGEVLELTGIETWQNLFDGQQYADYRILFEACDVRIDRPADGMRLVYDEASPGKIDDRAEAIISPEAWRDDVRWVFPDIADRRPELDPAEGRGSPVRFVYEHLPDENDDFGEATIHMEYLREGLQDLCPAPPERTVETFFRRDATNNPDGSVPNWFYYWGQTEARGGVEDVEYDATCDGSTDTYGYYYAGDSEIYICDPARGRGTNDLNHRTYRFIDNYAVTVRHEAAHRDHFEEWWEALGVSHMADRSGHTRTSWWKDLPGPDGPPNGRFERPRECYDCDFDFVPDPLERDLGLQPGRRNSCRDIHGRLAVWMDTDEHCLAWRAEFDWAPGEGRAYDWAKPGSQWPGG